MSEAQLLLAMQNKRGKGAVIIGDATTRFVPEEGYEVPSVDKSDSEAATIANAIQAHFLFADVGEGDFGRIVGAFAKKAVAASEEVIKQGDKGGEEQHMYVVGEGKFEVIVDEEKVAELETGA